MIRAGNGTLEVHVAFQVSLWNQVAQWEGRGRNQTTFIENLRICSLSCSRTQRAN